jgi:hypothetical protein
MSAHCHEILVVKKHASGAEEWFCPTCGRRFVVQWMPEYQCIILNMGDEVAIHNIGRGALVVPSNEIAPDDSRLSPFTDWVSNLDIESRLDGGELK